MSDTDYDGPVGEMPSLAIAYRRFDAAADEIRELRAANIALEHRARLAERDLAATADQRDELRAQVQAALKLLGELKATVAEVLS